MNVMERPKVVLTGHDRCCATANGTEQAEVLVVMSKGDEPLLFCRHHWNQHKDAIQTAEPYLWIDTKEESDAQGS
jgi:hypothetical protein